MLEQMFEKLFSIREHFEIENGVCKQTDKTHDTLSGCASPLKSLQVRQCLAEPTTCDEAALRILAGT